VFLGGRDWWVSTKFLGVHISKDLSWNTNTASLARKAQHKPPVQNQQATEQLHPPGCQKTQVYPSSAPLPPSTSCTHKLWTLTPLPPLQHLRCQYPDVNIFYCEYYFILLLFYMFYHYFFCMLHCGSVRIEISFQLHVLHVWQID